MFKTFDGFFLEDFQFPPIKYDWVKMMATNKTFRPDPSMA